MSKLIKGRPLDNMEFLQWLKLYFDQVTGGAGISGYDAEQRRALSKGGNGFMKSSESRRRRPSPPFPSHPPRAGLPLLTPIRLPIVTHEQRSRFPRAPRAAALRRPLWFLRRRRRPRPQRLGLQEAKGDCRTSKKRTRPSNTRWTLSSKNATSSSQS